MNKLTIPTLALSCLFATSIAWASEGNDCANQPEPYGTVVCPKIEEAKAQMAENRPPESFFDGSDGGGQRSQGGSVNPFDQGSSGDSTVNYDDAGDDGDGWQ